MPYQGLERRQGMDRDATLARIEERIASLHSELLGNGQPGRIQRIETDVEEHRKTVEEMQHKVWWASGMLVGAGHVLAAVGRKIGFLP